MVPLRVRTGPAAVADYPPGARFGPRRLESFQFVWILEGGAIWTWGTTRIQLRPGQLLLLRPGMRDLFQWRDSAPTRHAYVHFRIDAGLDGLGPQSRWPLVRQLTPGGPLEALCRYLLGLSMSGVRAPHKIADEVVALMVTIFMSHPPEVTEREALPGPLLRTADRVGRIWSDAGPRHVSLGELADAAALSHAQLARLFQRHFGLGPVATFERLRLVRAATILLRSNLSVEEVAHACGFTTPFHFSRRFRLLYGVPPSSYRKLAAPDPIAPLRHARLQDLAARLCVEEDWLLRFRRDQEERYRGLVLEMGRDVAGGVALYKLELPAELRGLGLTSQIMIDLVTVAHRHGATVALPVRYDEEEI